jgi:hypothetical protein
MGLTKPRAYQIYDIDYKQSVRVITLTNITLSGGAPSQVDSVNLSLNDRVLVAGQSNAAQNGLYYVTTVGSGSNGTWARSVDGNETGEIESGMIVMVTEGTVWADTSWKLVTNDPIIIGVSELVFEQNTGDAFGNINANGTSVTANTASGLLNITSGNNISITGNNITKTITIGVTGISLNSISNGTSNVNVVSSGGNVTVGVAGTSNVAVFSATGANITGTFGVSGNVSGGNISTAGQVIATGNITGGNLLTSGNIIDTGAISIITAASGNVNLAPNGTNTLVATTTGANITGTLNATGNANVGNLGTAGLIVATGNVTGGNLTTAGQLSATGNATVGNLTTTIANFTTFNSSQGGQVTGTLVATSSNAQFFNQTNASGYVTVAGYLTAVGNVTAGNIISNAAVIATGNITGGNILGNGAGLSGLNTFKTVAVSGGNSAVAANIADTLTLAAGSGIVLVANSASKTITFSTGGTGVSIFATGGDMELITDVVTDSLDLGLVTAAVTENNDLGGFFIEGFVSNDNFLPGTINGNILLANTVISTTGNITAGNLISTGITATTGNITGGNLITGAQVVATGNITGGNLITGAQVVATGNITGGNLVTAGRVVATGNVSGGNLAVSGNAVVTYAPASTIGATITASGANTQGGTGFADFLRATNASGGATNPNKSLRLTSTGSLEIINSAYTATIFSLSDAGVFSVPGPISVGGKQAVNGPAFRAFVAVGQTIVQGAQRKVTFGSETFDTNNNFASSTFTPTVEGYYQLNATVRISGTSGTGEVMIILYKNGAEYARGTNESGTEQGASFYSMQVSDIAYANGTTDNFEIYIQQSSGADRTTTAGSAISYFSGVMVRGA